MSFDDDGHYTDIHWNDGAARIPTWRQSFVDEPGHYNYLEFNQPTVNVSTTEQRQRSSGGGYEGLNAAEQRQPPTAHHYTGIGSAQGRSRTDPVEEPESGRPRDHNALRSEEHSAEYTSQYQPGAVYRRQGYEELDPSVVEQLRRRPQRSHSYTGINTHRSAIHSYLEVIGYSGTDNLDDPGRTAQGYEGLDPSVVEELRRRPQRPHSYAGINTSSPTDRSAIHSYLEVIGYSGTDNLDDPETAGESYEGLDPAEVAEFRRRANEPHDYAGLTGSNSGERQDEAKESEGYEGLDPVGVHGRI